MAISDTGKDRLSITLAVLGVYLFVVHPNAKGTNKPAEMLLPYYGTVLKILS